MFVYIDICFIDVYILIIWRWLKWHNGFSIHSWVVPRRKRMEKIKRETPSWSTLANRETHPSPVNTNTHVHTHIQSQNLRFEIFKISFKTIFTVNLLKGDLWSSLWCHANISSIQSVKYICAESAEIIGSWLQQHALVTRSLVLFVRPYWFHSSFACVCMISMLIYWFFWDLIVSFWLNFFWFILDL